jgi:hypothetical protein
VCIHVVSALWVYVYHNHESCAWSFISCWINGVFRWHGNLHTYVTYRRFISYKYFVLKNSDPPISVFEHSSDTELIDWLTSSAAFSWRHYSDTQAQGPSNIKTSGNAPVSRAPPIVILGSLLSRLEVLALNRIRPWGLEALRLPLCQCHVENSQITLALWRKRQGWQRKTPFQHDLLRRYHCTTDWWCLHNYCDPREYLWPLALEAWSLTSYMVYLESESITHQVCFASNHAYNYHANSPAQFIPPIYSLPLKTSTFRFFP